jgi:hypothetical protein
VYIKGTLMTSCGSALASAKLDFGAAAIAGAIEIAIQQTSATIPAPATIPALAKKLGPLLAMIFPLLLTFTLKRLRAGSMTLAPGRA